MISSLTSALLSADVFGKNSLPSGPAALKANESLNTWLLAKKAPDGKTDIKNAGGYMKYICGTTADAAVKTTKSPSLCVPETNDIDLVFENNLLVGQGSNVTVNQIKNGPVSLYFPQSINMNPSSKTSYVVGIWDVDSDDNSLVYLNTAYQFTSGLCEAGAGFTKAKLVDWNPTNIPKAFGKKETHRFIAMAWKAKAEVDGSKFPDTKFDKSGPLLIETAENELNSLTPIAGIWFTVFNPCPAGDTDCAQCQWVPNGQKDDPAASPPKPLVPFTKCLATDGKAGYCWFESDVYKCKSEPAECAADGSDINKVCQCDVPASKASDGTFPNGYCVSKTTKDCQAGGRSCKKQVCADVKTDKLPCDCKAPKTGMGTCSAADCNDATGKCS